jgi:hypothetical protein
MIQKITNRFAKYIIENPHRSEEVTKLLDDIQTFNQRKTVMKTIKIGHETAR